jgi:hypothetical protein
MTGIDEGPLVEFPRRERRGIILGLGKAQVWILASVTGVGLFVFVFAAQIVVPVAAILTPIGVLGAFSWRREPLLSLVITAARFASAAVTGQNTFTRNVHEEHKKFVTNPGTVMAGRTAPVDAAVVRLPGALGAVRILQVPGRGAVVINVKRQLISVTVRVNSRAWQMLDVHDKNHTYDGFVDWLASLEAPGLVKTTARIRADSAPATSLAAYVADRDRQQPPIVSTAAQHAYDQLVEVGAKRSMEFTNTITLTYCLPKLKAEIRQSGGGDAGIATVMTLAVDSVELGLTATGLQMAGWLTAGEVKAAISQATDPESFSKRTAIGPGERRSTLVHPPVMGMQARWGELSIDGSEHVTFWVAEWPRRERPAGFLEPLLYAGDSTRVITLEVAAIPLHRALNEVERAQTDLVVAQVIRDRFEQRTTRAQEREEQEVGTREDHLADGFVEMRFRGYVTISAGSREALNQARTEIVTAARRARIAIAPAYGRQAAAFVTAALPIGVSAQ